MKIDVDGEEFYVLRVESLHGVPGALSVELRTIAVRRTDSLADDIRTARELVESSKKT